MKSFRFHPIRRLREKKQFFKRGIRFVPFLFTLGNAFFGFCSIALAIEGERIAAIYCVFLAAMMDALDGRIARLMRVESELGVEMDSLCDAISFCLAPAFLAYAWSLRTLGFVGVMVGALFLIAGIVRLARFNLLHDQQSVFFIGLPTTIAGCFIVIVLLNANGLVYRPWFSFFLSFLLLLFSWLMISSIRFPAFKRGSLRVKKHYPVVGAVVLFAILTVMRLELSLLFLFSGYLLVSFGYQGYNFYKKNIERG
ncbi:CDP-diacylglycerol--serine O-phosphatidyltransferase [Candidatus Dependentiae bacterium]|nr:CDP-diacylglycerol--serine O-phosphatidyltransferase [Candidatus Dependentiae bacterium]